MANLISINNCRIENSRETVIPRLDWIFSGNEAWLVIGPNGGGKADFVNALSGIKDLKITPNGTEGSLYSNIFSDSIEIVSLERAARLIEEERLNDESEFTEGGVDIGRTGRVFIAEGILGPIKKNAPLPEEAKRLESYPAIKLCGIEKILDRGLKYMSTGEIRRTLLARALVSGKKLLILSDPFAGLDMQSRTILLDFFNTIVQKQGGDFPHVILGMERWHEIPDAINHVLEFSGKKITFCGKREDYEKLLQERSKEQEKNKDQAKSKLSDDFSRTLSDTAVLRNESEKSEEKGEILIEMNHVNVGWDGHQVLSDLSWKLLKGQHWLIQGPNGSGKTTFLELITGDNMQVFCNDVRLFGSKRGSGESIWDIKKHIGYVSPEMHRSYKRDLPAIRIVASGLMDSIGLYAVPNEQDYEKCRWWLNIFGIAHLAERHFLQLSSGEQRLVLLARAFVKDPQLLILDEPLHGLDLWNRRLTKDIIETFCHRRNKTMIMVTHYETELPKGITNKLFLARNL